MVFKGVNADRPCHTPVVHFSADLVLNRSNFFRRRPDVLKDDFISVWITSQGFQLRSMSTVPAKVATTKEDWPGNGFHMRAIRPSKLRFPESTEVVTRHLRNRIHDFIIQRRNFRYRWYIRLPCENRVLPEAGSDHRHQGNEFSLDPGQREVFTQFLRQSSFTTFGEILQPSSRKDYWYSYRGDGSNATEPCLRETPVSFKLPRTQAVKIRVRNHDPSSGPEESSSRYSA